MKKVRKKSSIKKRVFVPMIAIVMFQALFFFLILTLSGEFEYIENYAYDNLAEKTLNRKNYIESEMQQRWSSIYESVDDINSKAMEIFEENNADIEELKTDKNLSSEIMNSVTDDIVYMLRKNNVNDAFIILETGELYNSDGKNTKACLYLRDNEPLENSSGNDDIFMEVGYSSIAYDNNLTFDTGWCLSLEMKSEDEYDFYYQTMKTAEKNPFADIQDLGHWTKFSRISDFSSPSMKYTVPLISDTGTVYGVVGIGITEKSILRKLPSNDLLSENACYVLAVIDEDGKTYTPVMHSGSAYTRLVGTDEKLEVGKNISDSITTFVQSSGIDTIGNIQYMKLYNDYAPYSEEYWALISVADHEKVLTIYTTFVKMFLISAVISITAAIIISVFASRKISKPLTDIAVFLDNAETSINIKFENTGVEEIDKLTDAIEDLQLRVEDSASRVSKIINLVEIGIGAFMYDRPSRSVFIADSLIKLLGFIDLPERDTIISDTEFYERLVQLDTNHTLFSERNKNNAEEKLTEISGRVLKITQESGGAQWLKFNVVVDDMKMLGVVQDITSQTIERKRIEYERDYDITTGLLNRRAYYQQVAEKFQHKSNLKVSAFLMIDLDNLKYVNDTYGHEFGDDYIKTAANALKRFKEYKALVSRLSGDEFNVFLSGFDSKDEIRYIINNVRNELINSYCLLLDGSHYRIRASAGISWYPDDSKSYEQLMRYADFAMYTIKNNKKGSIAEFDIDTYNKDSILVTGIEEMNRIIDECSIKYAFHGIVSAKTGEIYGYEALMRPQSEILKSPLEFIRLAKTGAKLNAVEYMTWFQAFESFKIQIDKGNINPSAKLFVNSISNCIIPDRDIGKLEEKYSDIVGNVVLEVLEGEQVNDDYARKKKQLMKRWNAQIALDDFGTGYNSEYALITSNPDIIKIDRSLISGCDNDESRQNIIKSIIKVAHSRSVKVLAEGVETYSELAMVIKCDVDLIQGYYVNRPVFEPQKIPESITKEIRNLNGLK
jgi:diguanylate cyclase (GGDEF)-like protein